MAQIVCVDTGTYKAGINNIGDIVEYQEDGTIDPNSSGYKSMKVIKVKGMTRVEVESAIRKNKHETNVAYRTPKAANVWSLGEPERKEVWKDIDGKWYFIEKLPKYVENINNISQLELNTLDSNGTKLSKELILNSVTQNLTVDLINKTEAIDLNK